ncbi:MAG TPA: RDD family protein [Thermoanaerobaculia bacterium]|nr:RDD family protein [Thermoanaerobaculia bacterium]
MTEEPPQEPGLFDLPLEAPPPVPPSEPAAETRRARRGSPSRTLPLFTESEIEEHLAEHLPSPEPERHPIPAHVESVGRTRPVAVPSPAPEPPRAPLAPRLRAAVADLAILAAVVVVAAFGARALETPVGIAQAAPLALFGIAFSFLYFVIPLAFWGATPGMSWAGLVVRTAVSEPLSFGQTALRWLATWLTWALAGLPGLLALTGRSLADRLSGSATYELDSRSPAG